MVSLQNHQRQDMRREMTLLCLVFFLYMVVTGISDGAMRLLNLSEVEGGIGTTPDIWSHRISLLSYLGIYILMFAAPLGIYFCIKNKESVTDYFYIHRRPRLGVALLGSVGILAINYTFTIISDAGSMIFTRMGALADTTSQFGFSDDPLANGIYFVILVIAPAVLEEFCLRGIVCGRLAKYNRWAAVIFSAILFSLMHMTVSQIPFAFLAGLLLGYVYLRTGSIWSCVIIHAINNGFAYLSEYLFYRYEDNITMERIFMLSWAAIFVVGLVAVVILGLSHRDREESCPLSGSEAASACFSSPVFIICCSLALAATAMTVPLL